MKKEVVFIFLILVTLGFVSATPFLTIHSPQNADYNSTKILVNVTSSEPVDFFFKNLKTGKRNILVENSSTLESYLYLGEGQHEFTIWANNSNGETNATVSFNTTVHNPVSVTTCGYLTSSDTAYILENDVISSVESPCIALNEVRNVTFDLNGHTISGTSTASYRNRQSLGVWYVSASEVFNGSINGTASNHIVANGQCAQSTILEVDGSKLKFYDLNISGFQGIFGWNVNDVSFERINVNSSIGFWYYVVKNTYFVNSTFTWNGETPCDAMRPTETAIYDQSTYAEYYLEESSITGFPENDFYLENSFSDIYLRSTHPDMSKIRYSDSSADTRFFTQHLLKINVTDQLGLTGASSIKILDNGILPRKKGLDAKLSTLANPTAEINIPTEEDGTGQEWVTEKLTYAKSSSSPEIEEYVFSNYTLTARGWGNNESTTTNLNLTGLNSTIEVDFVINTALGGEKLPFCTISQMLDLNNDGLVNIQDAVIILRQISGLPVSISESKECTGININPF